MCQGLSSGTEHVPFLQLERLKRQRLKTLTHQACQPELTHAFLYHFWVPVLHLLWVVLLPITCSYDSLTEPQSGAHFAISSRDLRGPES